MENATWEKHESSRSPSWFEHLLLLKTENKKKQAKQEVWSPCLACFFFALLKANGQWYLNYPLSALPLGRCPIPIWATYKSIVIISRPPIIGRAAFCVQIKNIWEISRKYPHKRHPLFRVSEGRNIFVGNFEKHPAKRHPLFRISRRVLLKNWGDFSNYFAKISKKFPIG